MPLIFNGFSDPMQAIDFVERVKAEQPELSAHLHTDAARALRCEGLESWGDTAASIETIRTRLEADPSIAETYAIVVHVERPYGGDDDAIEYARSQGFANDEPTGAEIETELEELVVEYGGTFHGT